MTPPAQAQETNFSSWLPQVIVVIAVLVVSIVYLEPSPFEFPIDDTYIHFVYSENLSEHGGLYFNTSDEKGVGSSSLLYVLLLGAGNWAGLSMHWLAKLLGVACLAAVGIGLIHLLRPLFSAWAALAGALLVVLSGNMVWFALSGMDTILFLALGVLALLCYRAERWGWLGVVLGLLAITRLEGILLALAIGAADIWRTRTIRRGMLVAGAACGLIVVPWVLYLWSRTGHYLPTSGVGRHFINIIAVQVATAGNETLSRLSRFKALAYPFMWMGYSVEFTLGGIALPPPYLKINTGVGAFNYRFSVWAILGLATVVLPLLWISCRRLVRFLKTPNWANDQARLPLLILLFWMVLHNLSYMMYLPAIGAASRYANLNQIALWLALFLGIWHVRSPRYKVWLAAGLTAIALASTVYWNRVYDANLEHMVKVRIAAADFIREQIPENEPCAAFDIGALRYYGQHPLIDLGGLIDPDLIQWYQSGRFDQYLVENKVTCLVVPGRPGTTADSVFDVVEESGFSQSSLFELEEVSVFQIDRERWLTGYQPTLNYLNELTIYKMIY